MLSLSISFFYPLGEFGRKKKMLEQEKALRGLQPQKFQRISDAVLRRRNASLSPNIYSAATK
jgi:hypothetical protein